MGYIFSFKDSLAYDQWFNEPMNQRVIDFQSKLMINLLNPNSGETLLDIGCGSGLSLRSFADRNLYLTGIDPSPYMLDIAIKNFKNRVDFHRGYAENLPFDDNAFTYSILNTTLEFVENPSKALEEACRVTKDRIFIGILNRYALEGIKRRIKGLFVETIYNHARFFSIWEIKEIVRSILGDVPITWRTVGNLPASGSQFTSKVEESHFIQKSPFGAFAGMAVTLVPRFKTKPMKLKFCPKHYPGVVSG